MAPSKNNKRRLFDAVSALEESASPSTNTTSRKRLRQSKAAQSQVKLYGQLMQVRILLQRVLQEEGEDKEKSSMMDELMQQLLHAQALLTHEEAEDDDDNNDTANSTAATESTIQKRYTKIQQDAKTVLNKRQDQVRLHAGLTAKATFLQHEGNSFWAQVDATTQHVMHQSNDFDDAKLYQHMLQDYLNTTTTSSTDKSSTGKSSRNKKSTNKSVDRKATKGRKLRYAVIPKLVHFCFPQAKLASNAVMDQDEWFPSLFGGSANPQG